MRPERRSRRVSTVVSLVSLAVIVTLFVALLQGSRRPASSPRVTGRKSGTSTTATPASSPSAAPTGPVTTATTTTVPMALADFTAAASWSPTPCRSGNQEVRSQVTLIVANLGPGAAQGTEALSVLIRSRTGGGDTRVAVDMPEPGQSTTTTVCKDFAPGTYDVLADAGSAHPEVSETNNATTFEVPEH